MNLSVIGTGYVGLVAGACFAEGGNDVVCVDIDAAKIEKLKQGIIPIYEPGLPDLIERNVREERLTFTTDFDAAVKRSLVLFIAVGTPQAPDGSADLSAVFKVARDIGRIMDRYKLIVTKSTVPVGTTEKIRDLYAPFVRTGSPVLLMDIRTAEMVKYTANAFLAARISFMNEIANLCEEVGADSDMIRKSIATDGRIGPAFLFAGVGFGGSCFPKDIRALSQTAREHKYPMRILDAVDAVNQAQVDRF